MRTDASVKRYAVEAEGQRAINEASNLLSAEQVDMQITGSIRSGHFGRPAPDNLSDHFRTVVRRRVFKDRTVTINGLLFEAPVALIGQRVDLFYHPDRPRKVDPSGGRSGSIPCLDPP